MVYYMLLRERINEIRQTKHIPIERFVRNGISKNKYYRFVSGEGSVSIGDLQKIIEILTVSLSELVAESDERDSLIFNEFGDYWQLSLPELRERASVFAHRYMQTQMKAHYIASTVYELLAGRKAGEDISDYVDELYKELKRQRFFTIFDLQVFRILMPQLNVARFFKLYEVFAVSLRTYENYNPADGIELMVKVHATALSYAISSTARAQKYLSFVIEQIEALQGRPFTSEFSIMKRFVSIVRLYQSGNVDAAKRAFDSFNGAAKRLDVQRLWVSPNLLDFETFWKRLISIDPSKLQESDTALKSAEIETVDFGVFGMGEAFAFIMKLKKLSVHEFELAGMSHSKIYRVRKNLAEFDVEDLFAGMLAARLDVRDIDVYLTASSAAMGRPRFGMRHLSLTELQEAITKYEALAEETGLDLYTEMSLEFRGVVIKNTVKNWLTSPELQQLSDDVKTHLEHFDEWHESQHRLASWAFLDETTDVGVGQRMEILLSFTRNAQVFKYPYDPILINFDPVLMQAILRQDVAKAQEVYQRLFAEYQARPDLQIYFNYRWHKLLNEQLLKVVQDGFVVPMTIEGVLRDVDTVTGERRFIVPYLAILDAIREVYPAY